MFTAPQTLHTLHIVPGIHAGAEQHVAKPARGTSERKAIQAQQRGWLQEIINTSGDNLAQIAARAGVSDSTLSRLVNNPSYAGVLSPVSVMRITGAYQVPGPDEYGAPRRSGMIGFSEAERYDPTAAQDDVAALVQALLKLRSGSDAWRLKTDALEEAGYLAGDIVIVDLNAQPAAQDAVCAQVYDWKGGGAATVWRIYDPPYLVAAARERTAFKPLLVDNDRVIIKGVVDKMVRPHRLSANR